MKCPQAEPLIEDLLRGELPAPAATEVATHLESCPACRRQLEQLAWLDRALTEVAALEEADRLAALVRQAVLQREHVAPEHLLHASTAAPEPTGDDRLTSQLRSEAAAWELTELRQRAAEDRASTRRGLGWAALLAVTVAAVSWLWSAGKLDPYLPNNSIAQVSDVEGEVYITAPEGRRRARKGLRLYLEDGVSTVGSRSRVVLNYRDETRLEVAGNTTVQRLVGHAGVADSLVLRKEVFVDRGEVIADIPPQPVDRPMLFRSPFAEVEVRGTRLTFLSEPQWSRVEVREGLVRLTRNVDRRSIDVGADQFAMVRAEPESPAEFIAHALPAVDEQAPAAPATSAFEIAAMQAVAATFNGPPGIVLHLGDQWTQDPAYGAWARQGEGRTPAELELCRWLHAGEEDLLDGWRLATVRRSPTRSDTAAAGLQASQLLAGGKGGLPSLVEMLRCYQPQIVVLLIGSNDLQAGRSVEDYGRDVAMAVDTILDHHAICLLTTLPPRTQQSLLVEEYNAALVRIAQDRGVPVIDLHGEILSRRATDWHGSLVVGDESRLSSVVGSTTPTSPATEEHLQNSGNLLRTWLTLRKIAEVHQRVIEPLGKAGGEKEGMEEVEMPELDREDESAFPG